MAIGRPSPAAGLRADGLGRGLSGCMGSGTRGARLSVDAKRTRLSLTRSPRRPVVLPSYPGATKRWPLNVVPDNEQHDLALIRMYDLVHVRPAALRPMVVRLDLIHVRQSCDQEGHVQYSEYLLHHDQAAGPVCRRRDLQIRSR